MDFDQWKEWRVEVKDEIKHLSASQDKMKDELHLLRLDIARLGVQPTIPTDPQVVVKKAAISGVAGGGGALALLEIIKAVLQKFS